MTYATGDDEPEDGWDRNDPLPFLVENLRRRLALLLIVENARNRLRLEQLLEDLDWLRDRVT